MAEKVKSFADLQAQETVSPTELQATLKDYANGGWAISSQVVIDIIYKTGLTRNELTTLLNSAQQGTSVHMAMSERVQPAQLPPEIASQAGILASADYAESAQREKRRAEQGEAQKYEEVASAIRTLLGAV